MCNRFNALWVVHTAADGEAGVHFHAVARMLRRLQAGPQPCQGEGGMLFGHLPGGGGCSVPFKTLEMKPSEVRPI